MANMRATSRVRAVLGALLLVLLGVLYPEKQARSCGGPKLQTGQGSSTHGYCYENGPAKSCPLTSPSEQKKSCSSYTTKYSCEYATTQCATCESSKKCKWYPYDPPDSVPSLGEDVELAMQTGGSDFSFRWGEQIGFGPQRSLNYLAKLHLTTDLRFARVSSYGTTSSFERDAATWVYPRAVNQHDYGVDAYVSFGDIGGDGMPASATLYFPDGREWDFAFESDGPAVLNSLPGRVYRIAKRRTKEGYETSVAYNAGNVTVTDASDHAYVCTFDSGKRITQISVNARSWTYSYDGDTVTETNNQTGLTIATTMDADSRLTAVVMDGGTEGEDTQTEYFNYDAAGDLTSVVKNGITTTTTTTVNGEITTTVRTTDGLSETWISDATGLVTRIVDQGDLNLTSTYTNDDMHNTTSVTDPRAKTWTYVYDDNKRMTSNADPDGNFVNYVYDGPNLVTKTTPSGTWSYVYDANNQLISQTAPDDGVTQYVRGANGLVTKEINPLGYETDFTYNSMGQVLTMVGPYDPAVGPPATGMTYVYDLWGNRTSVTDENNILTSYGYDAADRLTSVTTFAGTTSYLYDGLGRKVKETDAMGAFTEWHYDARGFVTQISGSAAGGGGCTGCGQAAGAGGQLGDYEVNDAGNVTKFTDLKDHSTWYYYDGAGRRTRTVDARNYETIQTYDAAGNLTSVQDANTKVTTYTYTDAGRLQTVTNAESETVTYGYDLEGRQTSVADGAGGSRSTVYDSMGRVTQVSDGLGRSTSYAYDLAGNMTSMTDASGVVTTYAHDAGGNVRFTIADANGFAYETESQYDPGGRLVKTIDPLDHETVYAYDGANRLVTVTSHLGNVTTYAYDAVGRRTSVTAGGRTSTTTYNAAGWVITASDGATTTSYCYDDVGNRVCVTVSGRAPVYYSYDDTNNLTGTEQTSDGTTITTVRYVDPVGNVVTSIDGEDKLTGYSYDGANRVHTVTNPELEVTTYAYDGAGRRTSVSFDNGSSRSYGYNAAGDLTSTSGGPEGDLTYGYDTAGRQTSVTDANSRTRETFYDALGRVTRVENEMDQPVIYRYDDGGRRYELEDAKGNITVYDYDEDNRLVTMTYPEVAGQPANIETYDYNGAGLLTSKITPNGDTIGYGYDGAGRLASVNGVTYSRDGAGAVTSIAGPVTTIGYAYDDFGRMVSASDSTLARTISYAYDKRGLRTSLTLDATQVAYTYDDAMRLSTVKRQDETSPAVYSYDTGGRRESLALPNGVTTGYTYTGSDQLDVLTTTGPGGTLASFGYTVDGTGNRTGIAYADGSTSTYSFDDAYRLTGEVRTGPAGLIYEQTFEYDAVGNRTRMTGTGVRAYSTDADTTSLWHMDATVDGETGVVTVKDASGNGNDLEGSSGVESTDDARFEKAVAFDGFGFLVAADAATLELPGDFTMEAWVRPAALGGDSGIFAKWNPDADERSYKLYVDSDGHVVLLLSSDGTDATIATLAGAAAVSSGEDAEWTHVAAVRQGDAVRILVDGLEDASGTFTGTVYDGTADLVVGEGLEGVIDELRISSTARAVGVDLNRVAVDYRYNARNQLTTETCGLSVKTYSYDNNGNTTGIVEAVGGVEVSTAVMAYDKLNRMISYSGPEGDESFTYRGAEWHRFSSSAGGTTTQFLYDGDNVLADVEGGVADRVYVTPFLDQNMSMTGSGETYYYSQDGLGSARTLTDSGGTVENRYDYLPFGGAHQPGTSVTVEHRYAYTGRERSSASPMMYHRYRQYVPVRGRFMTRDPGQHGSLSLSNVYAYADNSPTRWADRWGLEKHTIEDSIIWTSTTHEDLDPGGTTTTRESKVTYTLEYETLCSTGVPVLKNYNIAEYNFENTLDELNMPTIIPILPVGVERSLEMKVEQESEEFKTCTGAPKCFIGTYVLRVYGTETISIELIASLEVSSKPAQARIHHWTHYTGPSGSPVSVPEVWRPEVEKRHTVVVSCCPSSSSGGD